MKFNLRFIFSVFFAFFIESSISGAVILVGIKDVLLEVNVHAVPGGWIGSFIGFTPEAVEHELFETIKTITPPNRAVAQRANGFYSPIMCYWLAYPYSSEEVKHLVFSKIAERCSFLQKNRLNMAAEIAFTPEKMSLVFKVNNGLLSVIRRLKQVGHSLVLCSNWNKESFQALARVHASTFSLFNAHFISGNMGILTTEKAFFTHIFNEFKIPPRHCYLIDRRPETMVSARKAGITTFHFSSAGQLQKDLQRAKLL